MALMQNFKVVKMSVFFGMMRCTQWI